MSGDEQSGDRTTNTPEWLNQLAVVFVLSVVGVQIDALVGVIRLNTLSWQPYFVQVFGAEIAWTPGSVLMGIGIFYYAHRKYDVFGVKASGA